MKLSPRFAVAYPRPCVRGGAQWGRRQQWAWLVPGALSTNVRTEAVRPPHAVHASGELVLWSGDGDSDGDWSGVGGDM